MRMMKDADAVTKFSNTHDGLNDKVCGYISGGVVCVVAHRITDVRQTSVAVFASDTNHRASTRIGSIDLLACRQGVRDPRLVNVYQDAYAMLPFNSFKGRTNVLYFDGHAAARTITELHDQKDDGGVSDNTSFARAGIRQ